MRIALAPALAAALFLAACEEEEEPILPPAHLPTVTAIAETEPVDTGDDAADDPAIWVHPTDPAKSVIIGTAKKSGLYVYNLDGSIRQFLPDGRINNVDIRDAMIGGSASALVAASDRTNKAIALYELDIASRMLSPISAPVPTGQEDPYGICLYRSAVSGDYFALVTDKPGTVGQWRIDLAADGRATAEAVRTVPIAGQSEGCVADDPAGVVYIGEEELGIWKVEAEPDAPAGPVAVGMLADLPELAGDIEGLTLLDRGDAGKLLIASSQGNSSYAVFSIGDGLDYLGSVAVADGVVDGTTETDGIDITGAALGPDYPAGLLVVQDDINSNPDANQNYKLISWEAVAKALGID